MNKYHIWTLFVLTIVPLHTSIARTKKAKISEEQSNEKMISRRESIQQREQEAIEHRKAPIQTQSYELDMVEKRKKVIRLINKGIKLLLSDQPTSTVMNAFSHDANYKDGELFLFVYNARGVCLANGQHKDFIWKNLADARDAYGYAYVQAMLDKASHGGGWLSFEFSGATKVVYVKKVQRGDKAYIIGCGYYPFSKEYAVIGLVKGAVELFNKATKEGKIVSETFSIYGYKLGRFVSGDLYIYAMTFKGDIVAHGERPDLIGTNGWDYQDAQGLYVNREIVKKLKQSNGNGIWVDYISKRAPKKVYAERIIDKNGQEFFIACGFYPDADQKAVIDLVNKGTKLMAGIGLEGAILEFNSQSSPEYRYGDLALFIYDLHGKCLADGSEPGRSFADDKHTTSVGRMMWDAVDDDGRFYIRELIQKALDGGGWITYKANNSFKSVYVELVNMGSGKYVVGSGLYPTSKIETMTLLGKSAANFLLSAPTLTEALAEFTKPSGHFIRGDLKVFVMTHDGVLYVNGDEYDMIWNNIKNVVDDSGTPIFNIITDAVQNGPGTIKYTSKKRNIIIYCEEVIKEGLRLIIGSGFSA